MSVVTEEDLRAAFDAGARTPRAVSVQIGRSLGYTRRLMRKVDFFPTPPDRNLTTSEQKQIMSRLLREGVPDKWVAESAGVTRFVVSAWKAELHLTGRRGCGPWVKTLREIKRDAALYALHLELAPKG